MNNRRLYITLTIAAVLGLLLFTRWSGNNDRLNWIENYAEKSKAPYGTFVFHQLLQSYFPEKNLIDIEKSLRQELKFPANETANYIFVGEAMFLDSLDIEHLIEFVKKGNQAFIISKTVPFKLMQQIYARQCNETAWDEYFSFYGSEIEMNLLHPELISDDSLTFYYFNSYGQTDYAWQYIDSIYFCDEDYSLAALGTLNDGLINFARLKAGEGVFYLHTTPLAFSNFHLLRKEGQHYAERVLSHLVKGPIFWDKYSRVPEYVGRNNNQGAGYSPQRESPLKYVLAQPSLAWAWYLALVLSIIYLLFGAKRRQRMIPVLAENKNTSLEFISTIGNLYFNQGDHRKIALQKIKLFNAFLRDRYSISTKTLDELFIDRVAAKSEIPEALLQQLILLINNINSSTFVSEKTLIDLHQKMEQFYNNCK